ncbi:hypothetical protein MNBD_CHLOROFLEXI01-3008 [hydrothermal vent metagenome]|uniref:Uncharacterized protein n=1 Tax=hydrothermal vent metagenome TaxID=652676 RepID=A0A3B0V0J1_9ZZZZ
MLVSCQTSDLDTSATTTTAVFTPSLETVTETAVSPNQVPTDAPTILATPLALPTAIPTQTAVPTETTTAVSTPSFSLAQRNPTLVEIEEFLSMTSVLFFYPDRELTLLSFDEYFMGRNLSEFTEFFYKDVNGDGEDDLIVADMFPFVWSSGFVIVMLWVGDQYGTPLGIVDIAKYSPGLRVSFEDWTNDNIPEVIFDFRSDTGGTGFIETTWTRYIIHCKLSCEVVWWGVTGQLSSYSTVGLITTNKSYNDNVNGLHLEWKHF